MDDRAVEFVTWKQIDGEWRHVFGDFHKKGASLEWHDFSLKEELDWAKSFHSGSLEVCLNFSGDAMFQYGKNGMVLRAEQVGIYTTTTAERIPAFRGASQRHRFFALEFTPSYLRHEFQQVMDGLLPEIRAFCEEKNVSPQLWMDVMPGQLLGLRAHLLDPPVSPAAHPVWYQSKITEVLTHFLFRPEASGELFCEQHHRINRERCERVLHLLYRDMENPPSLQMLADEVGCSSFYLSRLFAQEIGISIPKALRRMRIEKSAELLKEGGLSVTDVAMQVGYSSLGAFNKAFLEQMSCTPSQFAKNKKRE